MSIMEKADYILLSANEYSFKNEGEEHINTGISIQCISHGNLDPFDDMYKSRGGKFIARGYQPIKFAVPLELKNQIGPIPGVYTVSYKLSYWNGGVKQRVYSLEYLYSIEIIDPRVKTIDSHSSVA